MGIEQHLVTLVGGRQPAKMHGWYRAHMGDLDPPAQPVNQKTFFTPVELKSLAGMRTKTWAGYAARPRLSRYSVGLRAPREILIRFLLYQRMYESRA